MGVYPNLAVHGVGNAYRSTHSITIKSERLLLFLTLCERAFGCTLCVRILDRGDDVAHELWLPSDNRDSFGRGYQS